MGETDDGGQLASRVGHLELRPRLLRGASDGGLVARLGAECVRRTSDVHSLRKHADGDGRSLRLGGGSDDWRGHGLLHGGSEGGLERQDLLDDSLVGQGHHKHLAQVGGLLAGEPRALIDGELLADRELKDGIADVLEAEGVLPSDVAQLFEVGELLAKRRVVELEALGARCKALGRESTLRGLVGASVVLVIGSSNRVAPAKELTRGGARVNRLLPLIALANAGNLSDGDDSRSKDLSGFILPARRIETATVGLHNQRDALTKGGHAHLQAFRQADTNMCGGKRWDL